jgi:hypothetical protein
MALRLRRGTDAQRQLITPAQGELIFVTDTTELYIGDGTTVGGVRITGEVVNQLVQLNDVDAALPQDGDILVYDSATGDWVSQELPIEDLSNVDASGAIDGHVLVYNSVSGNWESTFVEGIGGVFQEGGDYRIDIIGGDSSTIVDSQNGTLQGRVLAPNGSVVLNNGTDGTDAVFTGDVVGDVAGSVTGDVQGNILDNVGDELISHTDRTFKGDILAPNNVKIVDNGTNGTDATFKGTLTGALIGDVVGDVTGNVQGNVFGGDSSILVNAEDGLAYARVAAANGTVVLDPGSDGTDARFEGVVNGVLNGQVNGPVRGDLTGSVFADDSSVIVDGVNRLVKGDIDAANIDASEYVRAGRILHGGLVKNRIILEDTGVGNNQLILTTENTNGSIQVAKPLVLGGTAASAANGQVILYTENTTVVPDVIVLNSNTTASTGAQMSLGRSRGTKGAPAVVQIGDELGNYLLGGFNGSDYVPGGGMKAEVVDTPVAARTPAKIQIFTKDASGNDQIAITVTPDVLTTAFGGPAKLVNYADSTARDAAITAPEAGMMVFITGTSKAQVYDGAAWVDLH